MPRLALKNKTGWTIRRSPLSDRERAELLAANPNPETVLINDLIAATRTEQQRLGWCSEAWAYMSRIEVERVPGGEKVGIFAEHPQWDPEERDYTRWARNPRIPGDVTTVPVAEVFRVVRETLRAYPSEQFRAGIDNILGSIGVTYSEPGTRIRFKFEGEINTAAIRRAGYTFTPGENPSEEDARYMAASLVRSQLNSNSQGFTFTVEEVPAGT